MKELYVSARDQYENLINQNPVAITITRKSRTESDSGGWVTNETTLDEQDFRIYSEGTLVTTVDEAGFHGRRISRLLAKWDADINERTADNRDEFTFGGKTYIITEVRPKHIKENIICKYCEVQEKE